MALNKPFSRFMCQWRNHVPFGRRIIPKRRKTISSRRIEILLFMTNYSRFLGLPVFIIALK